MARSRISESQVIDRDFVSEGELATTSGSLQTQIDAIPSAKTWKTITSNYTAVSGENLFVDTTGGAFIVTTYLNPSLGDSIVLIDSGGNCGTNYTTISGGAEKLQGQNQYLYINENYKTTALIYGGATSGWIMSPTPAIFSFTVDQFV